MVAFSPPMGKQQHNENVLTIYAFFLVGLVFSVVIVSRWRTARGTALQIPSSWHGRAISLLWRARHLVFHKLNVRPAWEWLGRPSAGLVATVGIFLIANVILCSTSFAMHALNHFASRYGWMGAANMALCVFFAMKNTPLSVITPVSHAEINIFHRIVGYAAALLILLHAILYTIHLGRQGRWAHFLEGPDLSGIGAGISMLILTLGGLYRHGRYEMFYFAHIAGFAAVVVLTMLHRPNWAKKLPQLMIFTGLLWTIDRIIRAAGLVRNAVNNRVTCHPLPGGATQVLLGKPSAQGATPGSYCYLWIPRVSLFQMHPFTIVSNGPSGLELVVKSHKGFTKKLGDFAAERPGRAAWVSMDGPYGALPDTKTYDRLLLVAGGSGAAFTFGLMNRMLHSSEASTSQPVDFVWTVRRAEHLSWFGKHLQDFAKNHPRIHMALHVTGEEPTSPRAERFVEFPQFSYHESKSDFGETEPLLCAPFVSSFRPPCKMEFEHKKLDAENVVRKAIASSASHDRMLIAVCGPRSLMDAVKDSVENCRGSTDRRIDVHCEDFGGL